jgi:putative toxin-antitoxin system antitoxin component (TIGR02293 family)
MANGSADFGDFGLHGALPAPSYESVRVVADGLPVESINLLKEQGLTFSEIAAIVPPRTLKHRKASGGKLNSEESERVLRVLRVLATAGRVFADHEKALAWLRTPDERMENRSSMSVLESEAGARLVESQLWALAEGVYT